jgi:hypothetical protein
MITVSLSILPSNAVFTPPDVTSLSLLVVGVASGVSKARIKVSDIRRSYFTLTTAGLIANFDVYISFICSYISITFICVFAYRCMAVIYWCLTIQSGC